MQKSLTLLVFGLGLVLVSARATFAKVEIPHVYFGPTTHLFNVNSSRPVPAEHPDRTGTGVCPLAAAGHPVPNRSATPNLNPGGAILIGALTLLLLQRRHRADNVLRPGH